MKNESFDDVVESIHNMFIMLMLTNGVIVGLLAYMIWRIWWIIPICFVATWMFPFIANLLRRIKDVRFLR